MVGTIPRYKRINQMWIRLLGLPLHLWSPKVFKEVGEVCGGWLETEEETELKNHLKWARIKVRGDGTSIPKIVKIEIEGVLFEIQVWCEEPVRSSDGENEEEESCNQWVKEKVSYQRVNENNLSTGGGAHGQLQPVQL